MLFRSRFAEHNLPAPHRVQLAARAIADLRANRDERLGGILEERCRCSLVVSNVNGRIPGRGRSVGPPPPGDVTAHAGDAEVSRELEMRSELIAIH